MPSGPEGRRRLAALLEENGHQVPSNHPGVVARGAEFEALVRGLGDAFFAHEGPDVRRLAFGPLLATPDFLKTGYLRNFPQFTGSLHAFLGDDAGHRRLLDSLDAGRPWDDEFVPAGLMAIPATCESVYPLYAGTLAGEARVGATSWCFRHEPTADPLRLVTFRICEEVYVGTAEGAIEHRDRWGSSITALFERLGLNATVAPASDPFFGRAGRLLASGQLASELKHEVGVEIYEGERTALSSFNLHGTHFGEAFGIRLTDGTLAHTSCAGFGIERVAIALLVRHGMQIAGWPRDVRDALGLERRR